GGRDAGWRGAGQCPRRDGPAGRPTARRHHPAGGLRFALGQPAREARVEGGGGPAGRGGRGVAEAAAEPERPAGGRVPGAVVAAAQGAEDPAGGTGSRAEMKGTWRGSDSARAPVTRPTRWQAVGVSPSAPGQDVVLAASTALIDVQPVKL